MKFTETKIEDESKPPIYSLRYGTILTDVSGGGEPGVYMKINKGKRGTGIIVKWTPDYCVIMNLKYGTLREIKAGTRVTVLAANLKYYKVSDVKPHQKLQDYNTFY